MNIVIETVAAMILALPVSDKARMPARIKPTLINMNADRDNFKPIFLLIMYFPLYVMDVDVKKIKIKDKRFGYHPIRLSSREDNFPWKTILLSPVGIYTHSLYADYQYENERGKGGNSTNLLITHQ